MADDLDPVPAAGQAIRATGLRFPLGGPGRGGFTLIRGTERLEQGMRLVLQTCPGERVMRPDFGCRLRDYLFESLTPPVLARLADEVERALTAAEPRVELDRVEVLPDPVVAGLARIVVWYRPRGEPTTRRLLADFRTDAAREEG